MIVAGDAAYNGVHLHLSESSDQQKGQEWIADVDKMESLKPREVIASAREPKRSATLFVTATFSLWIFSPEGLPLEQLPYDRFHFT